MQRALAPGSLARALRQRFGVRGLARASETKNIAKQGYTIARLGASASVRDMEDVAFKIMDVNRDNVGNYNSGGDIIREIIEDTVFADSAEGAPSEVAIQFHNEMAYATSFPKFVAFAMVKQAEEGGTTLLADNLKVQELMADSLYQKFKELGVQYSRHLHDRSEQNAPDYYMCWQNSFQTESIDEAMERGNNPKIYSVLSRRDERRLLHRIWCPVFHDHPEHGEVFFNSLLNRHGSWLDAHAYWGKIPNQERPYHCVWGDGEEFSATEIAEIRKVHDDSTIRINLDPGDVLVVDNLRVAHGRTPYRGDRKLGLMLSDMVPRSACAPPRVFAQQAAA